MWVGGREKIFIFFSSYYYFSHPPPTKRKRSEEAKSEKRRAREVEHKFSHKPREGDYKLFKYFRNVKRISKIIVLPVQYILRILSVDSRQNLMMTYRLIVQIYCDAHWLMIECQQVMVIF